MTDPVETFERNRDAAIRQARIAGQSMATGGIPPRVIAIGLLAEARHQLELAEEAER